MSLDNISYDNLIVLISEQQRVINDLTQKQRELEYKVQNLTGDIVTPEIQEEGVTYITRDQFKLLLKKYKTSEDITNFYLKHYDISPKTSKFWIERYVKHNEPFITREQYEILLRKNRFSETKIKNHLKDYDIDPEFSQLWLHKTLEKCVCVIM